MPYIYSKNVTYGSTDTGGRPGRPEEGGSKVYKAQGTVTSFKIISLIASLLLFLISC